MCLFYCLCFRHEMQLVIFFFYLSTPFFIPVWEMNVTWSLHGESQMNAIFCHRCWSDSGGCKATLSPFLLPAPTLQILGLIWTLCKPRVAGRENSGRSSVDFHSLISVQQDWDWEREWKTALSREFHLKETFPERKHGGCHYWLFILHMPVVW